MSPKNAITQDTLFLAKCEVLHLYINGHAKCVLYILKCVRRTNQRIGRTSSLQGKQGVHAGSLVWGGSSTANLLEPSRNDTYLFTADNVLSSSRIQGRALHSDTMITTTDYILVQMDREGNE